MPEPVAIAAAVNTLVLNGIKICLGVYTTIDGIKQAPKHIKAISKDLKTFYGLLGTIQTYLDDEDLTQGLLHTRTCESIQEILTNCVNILQEFEKIVAGYVSPGRLLKVTGWQAVSWTWKVKEIENMRRHLSDHKSSLGLAIAMANIMWVLS
jgi:ribosomal protein S15P/S13E